MEGTTLSERGLDLIWNIDVLCRRCVRAARYSQALTGRPIARRWKYAQNFFAAYAVVSWCKVFGSSSERTHYSNLWANSASRDRDEARRRLQQAVAMTDEEYNRFWQDVKAARDGFFAHNDFDEPSPQFPDVNNLEQVCLEMRSILFEVLSGCTSECPEIERNIRDWFRYHTNSDFLRELEHDLPHIERASLDN